MDLYTDKGFSFIPNLLPENAIRMSSRETMELLKKRLGSSLDKSLLPQFTDPNNYSDKFPHAIQSPVVEYPDGKWLKYTNMVGINVRTIQSFWNIVKYALTLPAFQDSIHILPIFEPGVVGSLYGMSSWQVNPEFYSSELCQEYPHLNTVEKQLRAVINILHAMGKTVGMDVIPHTDRFSEITLANPHYFEWLQRINTTIVNHQATLHHEVQNLILSFLDKYGSAEQQDFNTATFFSIKTCPDERTNILFGNPKNLQLRLNRRNQLINMLHKNGFEPVPATMGIPFRGIEVDPSAEKITIDDHGLEWRDYRFINPTNMSRVFNPLARYKLYDRLDNNEQWRIDFEKPRIEVWQYVCQKYAGIQNQFNFDFMRGDMSHVQMRPDGVPEKPDAFYDLLGAIKQHIHQKGIPYFGYFAESFLAADNIFAYGNEIAHLEASKADTTLGNLQSMKVGSPEFISSIHSYHHTAVHRNCSPNLTVFTADKDDPRFDEFFLKGNILRIFLAFCLGDLPSYSGLGFETRDIHHQPAPNEHYSKLYVFQEKKSSKATTGPYVWGQNGMHFHTLTRLRLFMEENWMSIINRPTQWLSYPNVSTQNKTISWTQQGTHPDFVFIANLDTEQHINNFLIPEFRKDTSLYLAFSTSENFENKDLTLSLQNSTYQIHSLAPAEGRVYKICY
ncbi:MAG: hypothetical protein JEZ06_05775 [Anaerolineaceae bacterium]|nr:hypothetical protein [Anaerolineaceae bacterium]